MIFLYICKFHLQMMKETKIIFQIDFESLQQIFFLFMIFVRVWLQEEIYGKYQKYKTCPFMANLSK